jgi:hypothetical protein
VRRTLPYRCFLPRLEIPIPSRLLERVCGRSSSPILNRGLLPPIDASFWQGREQDQIATSRLLITDSVRPLNQPNLGQNQCDSRVSNTSSKSSEQQPCSCEIYSIVCNK